MDQDTWQILFKGPDEVIYNHHDIPAPGLSDDVLIDLNQLKGIDIFLTDPFELLFHSFPILDVALKAGVVRGSGNQV